MADFSDLLAANGYLVLDGAMGTQLFAAGLSAGDPPEKWNVDHIRPLWEQKGKTFEEIDLTYWEEENLQTLCYNCHKKKTKKEASERAKVNRDKKK